MAQMKSQSLNSIRKIKLLNFILLASLLFVLSACQKDEYPRPTNAYYINDFANILYEATRDSIRREGEFLYDWSQDKTDGGTQLVIATFEVETVDDIASYDITDLYRQWRIGDDDMGVLVVMFFVPFVEDEITYLELAVPPQIVVGYRMEQYITPTQLGLIVDSTIYSDEDYELDIAVMHMVYEILTAIYLDVYDESFPYDLEVFEEYLINNPDTSSSDALPMGLIIYLLSPYATWGERISTALPFLIFFVLGGGLIKNVGGGGSSGGMGLFRRRR